MILTIGYVRSLDIVCFGIMICRVHTWKELQTNVILSRVSSIDTVFQIVDGPMRAKRSGGAAKNRPMENVSVYAIRRGSIGV